MSHVILWTQAECPVCEEAKARFAKTGYEERPAALLISGGLPDTEAMVQLAMQDMQLPLIMIDGRFVHPKQALEEAA